MGLSHYKKETGLAQWVWFLGALCELERRVAAGELRVAAEAQGMPWFSAPAVMHAALELDVLVDLAGAGFIAHRDGQGLHLFRMTKEGRVRVRELLDRIVTLHTIVGGATA